MDDDEVAIRVRVVGRVHGVWYRGWTVRQAEARGLRGWVRNRSDGTVEALFVGCGPVVDEMIAACRRGPQAARVDDVQVLPTVADETPMDFSQRETE